MTDYRKLDPIRERAVPLQLDAIEAYMDGRLTRGQFVRRATVLGLSVSTLATVLAACGGNRGGGGCGAGTVAAVVAVAVARRSRRTSAAPPSEPRRCSRAATCASRASRPRTRSIPWP